MALFRNAGKGMDEPTRKRVCEPFFTTKLHSRGLGMAAVYGMVKKKGGWLSIQSEPGCSATVSIYLQAQENERHGQHAEGSQQSGVPIGAGLIVTHDRHIDQEKRTTTSF